MKRFRTITIICLSIIAILVTANFWYMHRLYESIRMQTLRTVKECVRRADVLEIIDRKALASGLKEDFSIKVGIVVKGEIDSGGNFDFIHEMDKVNQTMSEEFHSVEQTDVTMPTRNYNRLALLLQNELKNYGIKLNRVVIVPFGENAGQIKGLWHIDFSITEGEPPLYTVYFSPLQKHVLRQMAGILATSSAVLALMIFLIWYLLHWVGKLRSIEQMKDDFTHNMTHELKTPVAVAYSAADSMLRYYDQSDEARNKQFLKIIMQRLSFLSGMIENILSMSMERFKTMKLSIENVEVKPIVEEVAGMIELKAEKPIKIDIDIPANLSVMADSLHFGNVLSNLIDNAVKYSRDTVNIKIKADNTSIVIADNGIGIDKDNLPYIFDKFYRVTSGDRYEVGGYGLGLFYVKQIVELLGWSIDVTSKPGVGTKFIIKFKNNEER